MEEQQQEPIDPESKNSSLLRKIGIFLVVASFVLYGGILVVPFTPFSGKIKILTGSILAVAGEVSFWIGGFILGKEFVAKYKKYLNPFHWLKKKDN